MNFNSLTLRKYSKKKSKVVDDRPFTSICDRSREKLMNRVGVEKTGRWVNCTNAANDSDDDPSDHDFKSFNHYFDEPIYSEPDLDKQHAAGDEEEAVDDDINDPLYDMLAITHARYHCQAASTDSDYESFSVDKAELYYQPGKKDEYLD